MWRPERCSVSRRNREAGSRNFACDGKQNIRLLIEAHEKSFDGEPVPIKRAHQLLREAHEKSYGLKNQRETLMLAVELKLLKLDEPEVNVISAGPLLDFFINGDDDLIRYAR